MIIIGKNPILEILRTNGGEGNKGNLRKTLKPDEKLKEIKSFCERENIPLMFLNRFQFEKYFNRKNKQEGISQGCVAFTEDYKYADLSEVISSLDLKTNPVLVILDEITDPQNMGAIIRSASCLGAVAVVIPKHRSAEINHTVIKSSSGAVNHIPVTRETNLVNAIKYLKQSGFWIAGTDSCGDSNVCSKDLKIPLGIVIGSEGKGIRKIVRDNCDFIVKIPMSGTLDSLNASVSAGIILYEILRQKTKIN